MVGRHPLGAGLLTVWSVEVRGGRQQVERRILPIAVTPASERARTLEHVLEAILTLQPATASNLDSGRREYLVGEVIPDMLRRELQYQGCWMGMFHSQPDYWP